MAIISTRIDDRLIHGQVASSWLGYVGAEQIICISDKAAANPVQEQILKMAAPNNRVHVFGIDKFIEITKTNPIKRSTFVITDSTLNVLKLIEAGIQIDKVNYGGMRMSDERHIKYGHDLCFSEEEYKAIDKIFDAGVPIYYQVAAYDSPVDIREQIKKNQGK